MAANHLGHSNPHKAAQWRAEYYRLQRTTQTRALRKAVEKVNSAFIQIIPDVRRFAEGLNGVMAQLEGVTRGGYTRA